MHAFTKKLLLSATAAATLCGAYITFAQANTASSSNASVTITNQSTNTPIVSDGYPQVLPGATETFNQPQAGSVVKYRANNNAKVGCDFYFQTGPKGEMMITSKMATSGQAQCTVAYGMHLGVKVSS